MNERIKDTPKRRQRRRRKKIIQISIISFFVAFFLTAFVFAFRIPQINIHTVTVEGNTSVASEDIIKLAEAELDGTTYFLFPKRNILLYPNAKIAEDIKASFKNIETVLVSADSASSIHIAIKERKAYALWCDGITTCYFLDDSGYVFSLAPTFSGDVYEKYLGVIEDNPVNKRFLTAEEFTQVDAFVKEVKGLGIEISSVTALGNNEFRINIKGNGYILFSTNAENNTLQDEFQNLATLVGQGTDSIAKKALPQYEYIDLRFSSKVIYKVQQQAAQTEIATSTAN